MRGKRFLQIQLKEEIAAIIVLLDTQQTFGWHVTLDQRYTVTLSLSDIACSSRLQLDFHLVRWNKPARRTFPNILGVLLPIMRHQRRWTDNRSTNSFFSNWETWHPTRKSGFTELLGVQHWRGPRPSFCQSIVWSKELSVEVPGRSGILQCNPVIQLEMELELVRNGNEADPRGCFISRHSSDPPSQFRTKSQNFWVTLSLLVNFTLSGTSWTPTNIGISQWSNFLTLPLTE